MAFKKSNLEGLIDFLRVHIGDTTGSPTYSDETLHNALRYGIMTLQPRWKSRYYLSADGVVTRSTSVRFEVAAPPVIQGKDVRAVILQASIIIKGGNKFSRSGSAVNWRDEEISFSNVESARQMSSTLTDDIQELEGLVPSKNKKLANALYGSLYGWANDWEKE
jgi:hypothetical protein